MQNTMGVVGGAKVFITSCTPQWASADWHANENVFNCSNVLFFLWRKWLTQVNRSYSIA